MISSDLGYIIHTRPYRETSQLINALGRETGRFSLVFRGARRGRQTPAQSFRLMQLSWSGKTDLKTVRTMETVENRVLSGRNLYVGLYLNELLMRVLREAQPVTSVFDRYHHLLQRLARQEEDLEPLLRSFEYSLLEQLGYGFSLDVDAATGEPVEAAKRYRFDPQQGLVSLAGERQASGDKNAYPGAYLLAMAAMDYSDERVKVAAKRLMREALDPHLGTRPLLSRELYRGFVGEQESGR